MGMNIQSDVSLKALHTFGVAAKTSQFADFRSEGELIDLLKRVEGRKIMILGGGSNVVFINDYEGCILRNQIQGIEVTEQSSVEVIVAVGGGVHWHTFVEWCLAHNLGGVENLSLIPGTVGAAPIQNIGAYGVELKDVFERLEAIDLTNGKQQVFEAEDCAFGYRDSIFKNDAKGQFCISKVFLRLNRGNHQINTSYGAIRDTLVEMNVKTPTIQTVSEAVIHIRQSKLPDPTEVGNAGSFFKNPEIEKDQFEELQRRIPNLVFYPLPDDRYKIPAGWLIDQAGWKGKSIGKVGCYHKQALVLINLGGATGKEVVKMAGSIRKSVNDHFGILLTPEVNLVGDT